MNADGHSFFCVCIYSMTVTYTKCTIKMLLWEQRKHGSWKVIQSNTILYSSEFSGNMTTSQVMHQEVEASFKHLLYSGGTQITA